MESEARPVDVLVLAAHAPDLRGLRRHLGDSLVGEVRGLRILAKTVGLGLPVASASTARRLLLLSPRTVVFVGTCGIYPSLPDVRPHDVIAANAVSLLDHGVLDRTTAFPEPMKTYLPCDPTISATLAASAGRGLVAPVASPLARTMSDELAARIGPTTGCQAENLEAFAIAQACDLAQRPFGILLGVTHIVGTNGERDFRQFERDSGIAACEALVAWVHRGAPGLPHG